MPENPQYELLNRGAGGLIRSTVKGSEDAPRQGTRTREQGASVAAMQLVDIKLASARADG